MKLNAYHLKWIAIVGMIMNHAVFALWEVLPVGLAAVLYAAGGLTFPILAYFVVEGYKHTSSLKKYILRLFIFAVIAMPFHMLVLRQFGLNIMFTIILSIVILILHDKMKIRPLFWLIFVLLLIVSAVSAMDWAIIGPIIVLMYHRMKNETARRMVPGIVAGVTMLCMILFGMWGVSQMTPETLEYMNPLMSDMNYWIVSATFIVGCVAAALLLKGYNDERGKRMKWTFYVIYPAHFAVLAATGIALRTLSLSVFGI